MAASGNKTTGAIIYTRVSTGEQAEHGTSLESQRDACRAKALALGLPIVAEYEDAGISGGFLLARQGLMAALSDLQAGRAATLICANISRFSRDAEHQQTIKKSVETAGGRLIFCDMSFDETPTGNLMFGIVGSFAQWERQEINRRCYGGRVKLAQKGIQAARTRSPYGYQIVGKADVLRGTAPAEDIGRYRIIPEQAAIVQRLFEQYATGAASLNMLTRQLNEEGIAGPRGGLWPMTTVHYLLNNPVYKGLAVFGRFDHTTDESRLSQRHKFTGQPITSTQIARPADPATWITWPVPAIVSEDIWDAAAHRLGENQRLRGGQPHRVRMLAGRIHCPVCGGSCVVKNARRKTPEDQARTGEAYYHYYTCTRHWRRKENPNQNSCVGDLYSVEKVEAAVLTALEAAANGQEAVQALLAAFNEPLPEDAADHMAQETARLDKALRDLDVQQSAAVKAQIAGIMAGASPHAYDAAFTELATKRGALTAQREALVRQRPRAKRGRNQEMTEEDLPRLMAETRRVLTHPDLPGDQKRDALGLIVEKVYCRTDGAEVVFLPGVLGEDTFQTSLNILEITGRSRHRGSCLES